VTAARGSASPAVASGALAQIYVHSLWFGKRGLGRIGFRASLRGERMPEQRGTPRQELAKFFQGHPPLGRTQPNLAAAQTLREIAESAAAAGSHFLAGYAQSQASHYVWGDPDAMFAMSKAALIEYQAAMNAPGVDRLEQIAALWMCRVEISLSRTLFGPSEVGPVYGMLGSELAHILYELGMEAEEALAKDGFLIRGLLLTTDLEGTWTAHFPEVEIQGTVVMGSPTAGPITLTVESAFQHYVEVSDYTAAQGLANLRPEAFTTHGLRGWRSAVAGLFNPDVAVECFAEAAEDFLQDLPGDNRTEAGLSWNSQNKDLWSKYFTARSAVAEIVRTPARAAELIARARDALVGTESGWVHPQVTCFRLILRVLDQLLGDDPDGAASRAKLALVQGRRLFAWDENDEFIFEFLDLVTTAFAELRHEPASVVLSTGVRDALAALGRIPIVGSAVATAISPLVAERTYAGLLGRDQSWMHRTIESISDERILQKLILRLLQGRLPLYAQIRHGPLEYGKDIVVLVEDNNDLVFQMYQVKAGDITVPVWRAARAELEEMFHVDVSSVQLPAEADRREGILIFNGHFNSNVEPLVSGWLAEQIADHHRSYSIMHLDSIVDWIMRKGLVNELRSGLTELEIAII
jgi:hypothetical protein